MPTNNDPAYVRLANRLSNGGVYDLETGWSITGLDVRKFPDEKNYRAARFVRQSLNAGKLEPASLAEWEEVHDTSVADAVLQQHPDFRQTASAFQEAHLQKAARDARAKLEEKRQERLESSDDYEDPEEARQAALQARLDEQADLGLDSDDPEEQKSLSTVGAPRKSSGSKKAARRRESE